nr:MAG TPA: hypothetical protein [Caudoviricetes sp.]
MGGCCYNKGLRNCLYSITAIRHLHGYIVNNMYLQ